MVIYVVRSVADQERLHPDCSGPKADGLRRALIPKSREAEREQRLKDNFASALKAADFAEAVLPVDAYQ